MESLVSFSKWLSKWFTVAVILWAAFNYALPATSSWVIPNTAYLLGLILFGMGLTLTTEDFKRIAKRPIPVVLGTVAHYVIMPGLAWLLCMIFQVGLHLVLWPSFQVGMLPWMSLLKPSQLSWHHS
jgi:bile acid:Na+ symporter, BASS family